FPMSQADPLPADAPALLKLDPGDDVAVALRDLAAGERVESLPIAEAVPTGHKVALADLEAGATVRKFGSPIGRATQPIRAGQHVHSHNLATLLGGVEGYAFEPAPIAAITPDTETRFMGYRRPDGRVATRQPVALGELAVGLKCGGSDGFSGLTANPLVGRLADRVIGAGGSAILTEIPEIFGAERLLMARARDGATFDRLVGLVNDFKR